LLDLAIARHPIHPGRVYYRENEIRRIEKLNKQAVDGWMHIGVKNYYKTEKLGGPWLDWDPTKLHPCLESFLLGLDTSILHHYFVS
jgi:hypothetical protein